jgi:hypothetical protein
LALLFFFFRCCGGLFATTSTARKKSAHASGSNSNLDLDCFAMPEATFEQIYAIHNNPMRMHIALTERQISAIGHVVVQWSVLDDQLLKLVDLWRTLPEIPKALASEQIDLRSGSRIDHLRKMAPYRLALKPQLLAEFLRTLSSVQRCKNRREWLAHGSFHILLNQDPEKVRVIYRGHTFKISTAKIEALNLEISILAGWFFNLEWRVNEGLHRASYEKRSQLEH